jgi:hypothetical protein
MATPATPSTDHPVAELNPSVGLATFLGILGTLIGLVAGVIAAIDGNDVATAGAGKLANLSPWIDEAQRLASEHATGGTTYSSPSRPNPIDPTLPSN